MNRLLPLSVLFLALSVFVSFGCGSSSEEQAEPASDSSAVPTETTDVVETAAVSSEPADIMALLDKSCVSCHSARMASGGLRLDSHEAIMEGGASGAAIVPGDAEGSYLVERLAAGPAQMPPGTPLSDAEVEAIRAWIDAGALSN